jgi:peptide chain release factor 1
MLEKLQNIRERILELERALSDPEVIADHSRLQEYAKEHSELAPVVETFNEYGQIVKEINETQELIKEEDDAEFLELAQEELADLNKKKDLLERNLKLMLIPKDPNRGKNVIVRAFQDVYQICHSARLESRCNKLSSNRCWRIQRDHFRRGRRRRIH